MALPGVKDFLAIQQEVFRDVHNTTDTTINVFPNLTEVKKIINDEYRKFVTSKEWPFARREKSFALVNGTADYNLATDIIKVGTLMREETRPARIYFVPRERFENAVPKGLVDATSGMPNVWTERDRSADNSLNIRFRPTPGADEDTLTVKFTAYIRPADLSANTDVMIVPVEQQDIPIMRAKAECFRLISMTDEQQVLLAKADDTEKKAWRDITSQPGYVEEVLDYYEQTEFRNDNLNARLFL